MKQDQGEKQERKGMALTPRLVLTLTLAGLLSGLILVSAYELTLPKIEANKAAALHRAVFKVLPGSTQMKRLLWKDGKLVPSEEKSAGDEAVYAAYDSTGAFMGYAIPWDGPGFQDTIQLLYGFDPVRKRITGLEILESRETPGLGDRVVKDADFHKNFTDLGVEPKVVLVKKPPENPNEVDAITGATISSRSVVNIINAGNEVWLPRLEKQGVEPSLEEPPTGEEKQPATKAGDAGEGGGA